MTEPVWVEVFLEALKDSSEDGKVRPSVAADWAGVATSWAYRYRKAHPDFAARWDKIAFQVRIDEQNRRLRRVKAYTEAYR